MITRKFVKAVLMQYSGIVGAGMFILPYLFYHSNFRFAVIWLVVVTFLMMFLNQMYLEIILDTKEDHQLPGYARIYLGSFFEYLVIFDMLVLGLGAASAYVHLGSNFLNLFVPSLSNFNCQLIFLFSLSLFHLCQFKVINKISHYLPLINIIIIIMLFSATLQIPFNVNISAPLSNFTFFGGLIFALTGFVIIPEVKAVLGEKKPRRLIWASRIGLILAALTYLTFIVSIVLLSGSELTADSITGIFHRSVLLGKILASLGFLLTFKACLNFILTLKELFFRDLHFASNKSAALSILIPFLSLFLARFSFINIITYTGSFTVVISASIIICVKLKLWITKSKKLKKSLILSRLLANISH